MVVRRSAALLVLGLLGTFASCATVLGLDQFEGGAAAGGGGASGGGGTGGAGAGGGDSKPPEGWWHASYLNRVQLTFLAVEEGAVDVPILVPLTADHIPLARDGGVDLCFVDADGVTTLPHEVEQWGADSAAVWVRVPEIAAGGTDHIWMYLGGPADTCPQAPEDVWQDYDLVYHFSDSLADDRVYSSAAEHDGIVNGMSSQDQGPCLAGDGLHFGGEGQSIVVEDTAQALDFAMPLGTVHTVEAWFRIDAVAVGALISRLRASCGWQIRTTAAPRVVARYQTALSDDCNNEPPAIDEVAHEVSADDWHYVAVVYDREVHTMTLFVDGALIGTSPLSLEEPLEPANLNIGGIANHAIFPGWIDEVRFGPFTLSPERATLHWRTMTQNGLPEVGEPESW